MKKVSLKLLVILLVVFGVVLLIAGILFAGGGKDTSTPKKTSSINLMASQNWIKEIDRELFEKFEKRTGIEVKVLLTPDNGYATLLGTTLSGGSDIIDIFMHPGGFDMISGNIDEISLDLSDQPWVSEYEPWALDANSIDGKVYGFSTWGVDYEGILYNKTLFEEKGWEVPNTWDGFIALCEEILAEGTAMPLYESINGTWHTQSWVLAMSPMVLAEDPEIFEKLNASKDNKWADLDTMHKGLTQIRDLLSHEPKYYTNDGQSEDWFGSYTALQNRESAMMFTYSAYPAELAANGATDEFGMFAVPLLDNTIPVLNGGGISKFINKNSENREASEALFNFLAEKENLETYYGARLDLVTSSFKGVENIFGTQATAEVIERSASDSPPSILMKNVLYWDPNIYQYMQGFAAEETSVEEFIDNIDEYRALMFDIVAE